MLASDGGAATRRELVSRGLALGALVAARSLVTAGAAQADSASEVELLLPALGTELLAVFAYERVLRSELMARGAQRAATRMLAHERSHVTIFGEAVQRLGGKPPQGLTSVSAADTVLAAHHIPNRLARLRTERDCITVLVRIEQVLEGAYFTAISKLADPRLLQLCAQVMACEAQHASALNLLLRPRDIDRALPGPFVKGSA